MPRESVIGWDVGGAHLKAARVDRDGCVVGVVQLPCPLWQGLDRLQAALGRALELLGGAAAHAVTMTGEMVDLFADRREGVAALVDATGAALGGARIRYWGGAHGFLGREAARRAPAELASANWQASAGLAAIQLPQALLVDIGSTTTDVVPIRAGRVVAGARDDCGRLAARELVYTGVVRTPVIALAPEVPHAGLAVPLMAELFATAADVHRLTGQLAERDDQHAAADGGDKSPEGSARRLARMIGRDLEDAPLDEWMRLARWLAARQARTIEEAIDVVASRAGLAGDAPIVGAGAGRFLARDIARRRGRPYRDFATLLPGAAADADRIAVCAPAVALAWLAQRTP
jgi:probable H4MPT-linked C1 transfer pathway protein